MNSTQKVMYITPKQVFEKVDFSFAETPESVFPGCVQTSLYIYANQDEFENIKHLLPPRETKDFTRNVVYKEIFSHTRFTTS